MARTGTPVPSALVVAAATGVVHAAFSLYWALGGTALLWSLGPELVKSFEGRLWLLWPVGLLKVAVALAPALLARRGWPARRLVRGLAWAAALALTVWGCLGALVAQLVLAGWVGDGQYDRGGMIGHAWLWDPLFVVWGLALALGLAQTRTSTRSRR